MTGDPFCRHRRVEGDAADRSWQCVRCGQPFRPVVVDDRQTPPVGPAPRRRKAAPLEGVVPAWTPVDEANLDRRVRR